VQSTGLVLALGLLVPVAAVAEDGVTTECAARAARLGAKVTTSFESGQGRWMVWSHTVWLTRRDGTRVGLERSGGGGLPRSSAGWVRDAGAARPTTQERGVLLGCAGYVARDSTDARDVLVRAPALIELFGSTSDASPAAHSVVASKPVPLRLGRPASLRARESWAPGPQVGTWDAAECPCFEVFAGDAFVDVLSPDRPRYYPAYGRLTDGPPPPEPWVVYVSLARNGTFAFGQRVGPDRVRWLGTHYGPARLLGNAAGAWWIELMDVHEAYGGTLLRWDGTTARLVTLRIPGSLRIDALDEVGVRLHFFDARACGGDDELGCRGTVTWKTIDRALAAPGTELDPDVQAVSAATPERP